MALKKRKSKLLANDRLNFCKLAGLFMLVSALGCKVESQKSGKENSSKSKKTEIERIEGRIDGDSMAPTLKGEHQVAKCTVCNFEYCFASQNGNAPEKICCPQCGNTDNRSSIAKQGNAETVQILKLNDDQQIQRWEVVAFDNEGETSIKRVVGLPFEKITFQNGDVLANGFLYAKPPHVQLETRILLFDSNFLHPDHLKFGQLKIGPATTAKKWPLSLKGKDLSIDFVKFKNFQSVRTDGEGLIKDHYGYNQSLSRSLNECCDFGIELEFEGIDSAKKDAFDIRVELNSKIYGNVAFQVEIDEQIMMPFVFQNGNRIMAGKNVYRDSELKIYFSVIDGRARVLFGSNKDKAVSLDRLTTTYRKVVPPIRFENQMSCDAKLTRAKIYRDIYYFEKVATDSKPSEKDQFFVLGDNVPVSKDSRQGGIRPKRSQIVGVLER